MVDVYIPKSLNPTELISHARRQEQTGELAPWAVRYMLASDLSEELQTYSIDITLPMLEELKTLRDNGFEFIPQREIISALNAGDIVEIPKDYFDILPLKSHLYDRTFSRIGDGEYQQLPSPSSDKRWFTKVNEAVPTVGERDRFESTVLRGILGTHGNTSYRISADNLAKLSTEGRMYALAQLGSIVLTSESGAEGIFNIHMKYPFSYGGYTHKSENPISLAEFPFSSEETLIKLKEKEEIKQAVRMISNANSYVPISDNVFEVFRVEDCDDCGAACTSGRILTVQGTVEDLKARNLFRLDNIPEEGEDREGGEDDDGHYREDTFVCQTCYRG